MTLSAIHCSSDGRLIKAIAESKVSLPSSRRSKSWTEFVVIQIPSKSRSAVRQKSLVDLGNRRFFLRTNASLFGKDGEHSAFVTSHTIVIALSQLPSASKPY